MTNDQKERTSRRGFLSVAATTGGVLGLGSIVYGQQQQGVATSYLLGGLTSGWQGREPQSIAGTVNPTLNLTPGRRYEVTWENVDGAPHNFAILDANGQVLLRTEIISQQGATQTTTFTANQNMATYLCQVHPTSMRGQIALDGRTTPTGAPTRNATQTETPIRNVTEFPEEQQTPGPLGESAQKFIARLEPKEGIQSNATGTTYFTLHPPNGEVAKLLYHITVEDVDLDSITAAHIHLDRPGGNPIVAPLFTPNRATPGNRTTPGTNVTGNATRTPVSDESAAQGNRTTTGTNVTGNATRTPSTPVPRSRGLVLTHGLLTARDLTGPFSDASLVRLVEAMHNDNVFVQVHTEQYPAGLLRGPIQAVQR